MRKVLDYQASTKYRETWRVWEAVREVIQDAIDSGEKVKVFEDVFQQVWLKDLLPAERNRLDAVRVVVEKAAGSKIRYLQVGHFTPKAKCRGEAKYQGFIRISRDLLVGWRMAQLWDTMIHEMVHYAYGYRDVTEEFQKMYGFLAGKVAHILASERR